MHVCVFVQFSIALQAIKIKAKEEEEEKTARRCLENKGGEENT